MLVLIEEQIRNRQPVILPSRDAMTHFVSKHSAADFILQALGEAKRHNFKSRMYAWDAGSPVSLIDIARKMAHLYGLRSDLDLAFKYTNRFNETGLMSSEEKSDAEPSYPLGWEGHNGCPEVLKSIFKDFVNLCTDQPAFQDWKARTWELLNLCNQVSRLSTHGGFLNGRNKSQMPIPKQD
jgi:hypothetical protein